MDVTLTCAVADHKTRALLESVVLATQPLLLFHVVVHYVEQVDELLIRADRQVDDMVLLDWAFAQAATPSLIQQLLARHSDLYIVALLPAAYRQYRQAVWEAGACSGLPHTALDQELLASALWLLHYTLARKQQLASPISAAADRPDLDTAPPPGRSP